MDRADQQRIEQFLGKWLGSEGNERANYQGFFLDLCRVVGAEGPPPKGSAAGDPYCFDKDIKFYSSEKTAPSTRFADFYKEGCFLIEAKQGSEKSRKGHGKRGTKVYRDVMQKVLNQARQYTGMLSMSRIINQTEKTKALLLRHIVASQHMRDVYHTKTFRQSSRET